MSQKYIVGDIVMYKNRIHTIIGISASYSYKLSDVRNPVSPVIISGVPLTPEILEKNGWVKDKEAYINDSYHLHLCGNYDRYSVYKVVNDNIVWLTGVRNVSDLQHLLFGLGINHEMEVQLWQRE